MTSPKFYTYLWLRKNQSPYYAGKGTRNRAFVKHDLARVPPRNRIVVFPMESEALAFESEIALIALFGRKDNGAGILRNLSDGGDKPPLPKKGHGLGCKRGPFTPEHSRNLSAALLGNKNNLGIKRSAETRLKHSLANIRRGPRSEETREKIRRAKLGTTHSLETRRKMSLSHKRTTTIAALLIILLFCAGNALALTPQITLTATAQSILGTSQTISMTVTLLDPNSSGMLKAGSVVVTNFTATSASATSVTIGPFYGSDVIADGFGNLNQTYYKVQVFPVSNGVIASTPALQNFYAFIGSGTIDVSSATPLSPSFQTGTSGNVVLPGTLSVSGLITASSGVAGIGPKFQQFTSNGTFTIPTGVTGVKVTVVGGGGGGTGGVAGSTGTGGGGAGAAIKWLSGLTPGNTIIVTVGGGGAGGTNGATASSGTASTIASGTQVITTVTGGGGSGGNPGIGATGGAPGAGTNGDINFTAVAAAPTTSNGMGTNGASSLFGGGGTASGVNTPTAGTAPGSGGGGAANGGVLATGASGAAGIVIFEWVN